MSCEKHEDYCETLHPFMTCEEANGIGHELHCYYNHPGETCQQYYNRIGLLLWM